MSRICPVGRWFLRREDGGGRMEYLNYQRRFLPDPFFAYDFLEREADKLALELHAEKVDRVPSQSQADTR